MLIKISEQYQMQVVDSSYLIVVITLHFYCYITLFVILCQPKFIYSIF